MRRLLEEPTTVPRDPENRKSVIQSERRPLEKIRGKDGAVGRNPPPLPAVCCSGVSQNRTLYVSRMSRPGNGATDFSTEVLVRASEFVRFVPLRLISCCTLPVNTR